MNAATKGNDIVTSQAVADSPARAGGAASGAGAPTPPALGAVDSAARVETAASGERTRFGGVLLAATPARWFEVACERWRELLVDHANCEKKAASTALSLIFSYPEDMALTDKLSRLA